MHLYHKPHPGHTPARNEPSHIQALCRRLRRTAHIRTPTTALAVPSPRRPLHTHARHQASLTCCTLATTQTVPQAHPPSPTRRSTSPHLRSQTTPKGYPAASILPAKLAAGTSPAHPAPRRTLLPIHPTPNSCTHKPELHRDNQHGNAALPSPTPHATHQVAHAKTCTKLLRRGRLPTTAVLHLKTHVHRLAAHQHHQPTTEQACTHAGPTLPSHTGPHTSAPTATTTPPLLQ